MSSGGGGNQTVTQQTVLPGWVQDAASLNINNAQSLAAQPYTPYTGPEVAPLSPLQNQAIGAVQQNYNQAQPAYATAVNNVTNLPTTTQSLLNPYLGAVEGDVTSNMMRSEAENQGALSDAAAAVGAFGGTRTGVQNALLGSETQRNIGQAVNQISAQGYTQAANEALSQGIDLGQLATGEQNASLLGDQALLSAGTLQQNQTQAEYANALQQWQAAQNYPYQQLAVAQSALAGTPYGGTVTAQQPYNSNTALQMAGLGISAIPATYLLGNMAGLWGAGTGAAGASGAIGGGAALGSGAAAAGGLDAAFGTGVAGAGALGADAALGTAGTAAAADAAGSGLLATAAEAAPALLLA